MSGTRYLSVNSAGAALQFAPPAIVEHTAQLLRWIEASAAMVEAETGWPVRTARRTILAPAVPAAGRLNVGRVFGARHVVKAEYAVAADGPGVFSGRAAVGAPDVDPATLDAATLPADRFELVGGGPRVAPVCLVSPPRAGWPAAALAWRVTLAVGMDPADYPGIAAAMVRICAALADGVIVLPEDWKAMLR